mmetsp:Transcript_28312/g.51180  ORF Transcript_28312/g.51180 Transcript_28312/m.51180 type:complete len:319 (+) Transcript_28312:186-1142(+)
MRGECTTTTFIRRFRDWLRDLHGLDGLGNFLASSSSSSSSRGYHGLQISAKRGRWLTSSSGSGNSRNDNFIARKIAVAVRSFRRHIFRRSNFRFFHANIIGSALLRHYLSVRGVRKERARLRDGWTSLVVGIVHLWRFRLSTIHANILAALLHHYLGVRGVEKERARLRDGWLLVVEVVGILTWRFHLSAKHIHRSGKSSGCRFRQIIVDIIATRRNGHGNLLGGVLCSFVPSHIHSSSYHVANYIHVKSGIFCILRHEIDIEPTEIGHGALHGIHHAAVIHGRARHNDLLGGGLCYFGSVRGCSGCGWCDSGAFLGE